MKPILSLADVPKSKYFTFKSKYTMPDCGFIARTDWPDKKWATVTSRGWGGPDQYQLISSKYNSPAELIEKLLPHFYVFGFDWEWHMYNWLSENIRS